MKFVLGGGIDSALTHFALVGLAAILQESGAQQVRFWWEDGDKARATITWEGVTVGEAVHRHAQRHADPSSWVQAVVPDKQLGLFSPRLTTPATKEEWAVLLKAREDVLAGGLTTLDHAMITNLGEPGYWVVHNKQNLPDRAASRWEMKTRNRGEEFVARRLAPLAKVVADRDSAAIEAGLRGEALQDIHGKNKVDSRTATGLTPPGPTDDALAWCGLWGISAFKLIPAISDTSATAGAFPVHEYRPDGLVIPILESPTTLAHWTHLMSLKSVPASQSKNPLERSVAVETLQRFGVIGLCVFPVEIAGSSSAPEQRLLAGSFTPIGQDDHD